MLKWGQEEEALRLSRHLFLSYQAVRMSDRPVSLYKVLSPEDSSQGFHCPWKAKLEEREIIRERQTKERDQVRAWPMAPD